jgi:hypothetical protein
MHFYTKKGQVEMEWGEGKRGRKREREKERKREREKERKREREKERKRVSFC